MDEDLDDAAYEENAPSFLVSLNDLHSHPVADFAPKARVTVGRDDEFEHEGKTHSSVTEEWAGTIRIIDKGAAQVSFWFDERDVLEGLPWKDFKRLMRAAVEARVALAGDVSLREPHVHDMHDGIGYSIQLDRVATLKDVYERARVVEDELLAPIQQARTRVNEVVDTTRLVIGGIEAMTDKPNRAADAKRQVLGHALDLQDSVSRYLSVLGDDRGVSNNMSRTSHLGLLVNAGRSLDAAWRTARVDLRRTTIAQFFETSIEKRLSPVMQLTDAPEHADVWDEQVQKLARQLENLIEQLEKTGSIEDELGAHGFKNISRHKYGGYAVLYRAEDNLGQPTALKVLAPHPAIPPGRAEPRFRREAEALTKLAHPSVVRYRRLLTVDNSHVLEMEFVEGTTLLDWIKPGREFGDVTYVDRTRAIIALLHGVQHAHDHGVYHRDIKPDNVLVRRDNSVVLVDFGLAWITGEVDTNLTTQTTWSLDYAPPEVRDDPAQSRGPNHDIYSVGVVLHQLITGRRAIQSPTPFVELDAALAPLDPVFQRAIAPLATRFASAAEFANALEVAVGEVEQM